MDTIIQKAEAKYLKDSFAEELRVGDTIVAVSKVVEGEKSRLQSFEGVVISIQGKGISKNLKIRKISHGIGAEKTIPLHSPLLEKIQILKKGKVRRAKLYYLRERIGKRALKVALRKDKPSKIENPSVKPKPNTAAAETTKTAESQEKNLSQTRQQPL